MINKIIFDMDGTIADLYNIENWLEALRREEVYPYEIAKPIWNMEELRTVLLQLKEKGYIIVICSWLSLGSSKAYSAEVRKAKRQWLKLYNFPYDEIHIVKFGTPKHYITKGDNQILIDDSEGVRNSWNKGATINPTNTNIIEELKKLL